MHPEAVLNDGDNDVFARQTGKMVVSGSAESESAAVDPDENWQGGFICENWAVNIFLGLILIQKDSMR